MRKLFFYFKTRNKYSEPMVEHDFLLRCIPQELPEQKLIDLELIVRPHPACGRYGYDSFGNRTYTGRLPEAHRFFQYAVRGNALRDDSLQQISPRPMPAFYYPSRLTQPSDSLKALLEKIPVHDQILHQAELIREAVHSHMVYRSGSTNIHTTAAEAAAHGEGVCQDFTHVFLALCRMRRIPCRYVNGLPEGEGASHAWAEVWFEGKWYGMDPTRNCPSDETYLKLCTGRDFLDCPIETGVLRGSAMQLQDVYTKVKTVSIG